MKKEFQKICLMAVAVVLLAAASDERAIVLSVSDYDPGARSGEGVIWEQMDLNADRSTRYRLIAPQSGHEYIRAESSNAASGLIYIRNIDPETHPIVEWTWKIEQVLEKGDLRRKRGDDYSARIYITFEYDRSRLSLTDRIKLWAIETFTSYEIPLRALNYIWANKAPVGTIAPNPFSDWVQMVAVESGNDRAGEWITERRNLREDYRSAFGEEPGRITGVAIMTDTDNTGESTTGYYRDIIFSAENTSSLK